MSKDEKVVVLRARVGSLKELANPNQRFADNSKYVSRMDNREIEHYRQRVIDRSRHIPEKGKP